MNESRWAPPLADLAVLGRRGLVVGALAGVVSAAGLVLNPAQFYRSYLVAFVFVLGVALGSLAISMLHHMSGGALCWCRSPRCGPRSTGWERMGASTTNSATASPTAAASR